MKCWVCRVSSFGVCVGLKDLAKGAGGGLVIFLWLTNGERKKRERRDRKEEIGKKR